MTCAVGKKIFFYSFIIKQGIWNAPPTPSKSTSPGPVQKGLNISNQFWGLHYDEVEDEYYFV